MLVLLLILIIPYALCVPDPTLPNATVLEIQNINKLEFSREEVVLGLTATFTFKISNLNYALNELHIESYYYSITFVGEEYHEERTPLEIIPSNTNETEYHGVLKMKNLEEEGNYLICVIFINTTAHLIVSSRFCHVVSLSHDCKLEAADGTFDNQHIYVLLPFVAFMLLLVVIITRIKSFVKRPRTIEAILETLPQHHAQRLESLAPDADARRRRRTQQDINDHIRQDSVIEIQGNLGGDENFTMYYNTDNTSLETIQE
ncbi:unnamed protein product [Adineta steineri]|uniref:Uncharacterized protein n=1 Tax=Adineta steineri TaxID=433720 RepID=A0A814BNU5_9BILA|nr:unnamed protein product [Adineta steineri]CAF0994263.1 unnamed protein product [Adineta steineri]CAF3747117.1 unnamed protein product [Adineta steineri]